MAKKVFTDESLALFVDEIKSYIAYNLNVNYETLAFDTSEIVIGGGSNTPEASASSPILGQGMLGYMVLA